MPRIDVPLGPQVYKAQSPALAYMLSKNMYAERAPPGADVEYGLLLSPGIEEWVTVGVGPARGYHVFLEELYVVSGQTLYKVAEDGTVTAIGTIPGTTEELVQLEDNGIHLVVLTGESDGYKGYRSDGATVTQITDPDFPLADWITFMDQQLAVGVVDSDEWQISGVADAVNWDALDFATAEYAPDKLVRGIRQASELVLFGGSTTEFWWNSGNADFPFERAPDGVIDVGCAAKRSVVPLDNTLFWLGIEQGGLSVRRLAGRAPQKVSHEGIDLALDRASTVSDARGFGFTYRGHALYVLTLPTAQQTFVYDISTNLWHERGSRGIGFWRALGVAAAYKQLLVIDSVTSKVGRLSGDVFTEFGDQMLWEITGTPVKSMKRTGSIDRFVLDMEPGTALRSGQGSSPLLFLSWSDDSGRTFGNLRSKSMGEAGNFGSELVWTRLGHSKKRLFKLHGAEPIGTMLLGAYIDARLGV